MKYVKQLRTQTDGFCSTTVVCWETCVPVFAPNLKTQINLISQNTWLTLYSELNARTMRVYFSDDFKMSIPQNEKSIPRASLIESS